MDGCMPLVLPPDAFLTEVSRRLDWRALAPWVAAVEARAGSPLSVAIFKMALLRRWFGLSDEELDDACHGHQALRRFLGAPLHGPVAEVWMFRQFGPVLARAGEQVERFHQAVDLMLADHGLEVVAGAWPRPRVAQPTHQDLAGLRTTVFEPGTLAALAHEALHQSEVEALAALDRRPPPPATPARTDRFGPVPASNPAQIEWPWGLISPITGPLAIGRDPGFSPFARQLWADPRISRRHALVEPDEDGVRIRDLGASNGTYVGDELIAHGASAVVAQDAIVLFGPNLAVRILFG